MYENIDLRFMVTKELPTFTEFINNKILGETIKKHETQEEGNWIQERGQAGSPKTCCL
jgi:hypothetical protein